MKLFFALPLLYLAANIYLFVHLCKEFANSSLPVKILLFGLFWTAAFSLFVSLFLRDANLPVWLSKSLYMVGSIWMVFTLYMVMALFVGDIIRLCIPIVRPLLNSYSFLIAFCFTASLLLYGYYNYRNPKINTITINTTNIPNNNPDTTTHNPLFTDHGVKIVAITDVHLGNGTGKRLLGKYVEMINAQSPDMILIGGDLIDNSVEPLYRENMARELCSLKAPMGIYMVPGNHEYISGIDKVEEFLKQTPIRLLKDSVIHLPCGICLIGRDDHSNKNRKSLEELLAISSATQDTCSNSGHATPAILLDHQPYKLAQADKSGILLQIYGHTHRGQVWPLNLLVDKLYEQSHGYRKWENSHIYVSSGLSLWGPPLRIGTESEMVVVNITAMQQ